MGEARGGGGLWWRGLSATNSGCFTSLASPRDIGQQATSDRSRRNNSRAAFPQKRRRGRSCTRGHVTPGGGKGWTVLWGLHPVLLPDLVRSHRDVCHNSQGKHYMEIHGRRCGVQPQLLLCPRGRVCLASVTGTITLSHLGFCVESHPGFSSEILSSGNWRTVPYGACTEQAPGGLWCPWGPHEGRPEPTASTTPAGPAGRAHSAHLQPSKER